MAVYWMTFRIADDETYGERYDALVGAVSDHVDGESWEEPTSFWLFQSESSIEELAASAYVAIDPEVDIVLIGSMEHAGATLVGAADDLDSLRALIPNLET